MTLGQIRVDGKTRPEGCAFVLATEGGGPSQVVLTSSHVVENHDPSTLVFETEAGRFVPVESVRQAKDLDAAVLHLAEEVRGGFPVRHAQRNAEWRVDTNPGGRAAELVGTVTSAKRVHKDRRSETPLIQLHAKDSGMGTYGGYSGSPVLIGEPGAVAGILRKEHPSRLGASLGGKRPASTILWAVPIEEVLKRFGLTAGWASDEPRKRSVNTAGRKPPNFVARPKKLQELRDAVISEQKADRGGLVCLHGMPGCGKTTLATALCEDKSIEKAFGDGVVWLDIGQAPRNLADQIKQVSLALTRAPGYFDTLEAGADHLKQLLADRDVFLVLDDVWDVKDMKPFLVNAQGCCVLFTTRMAEIALGLDVPEVDLGVLTLGQATALLRKWANRGDPALSEIAERLGNLPLALRLAGAQLREDNRSGKEWLADFRDVAQLRLGRYSSDPQDNLVACFDLSVNQLSEDDRGLFYALGIFPEDARVPQGVLALLWQGLSTGLSDHDCGELATHLVRMALIERDPADGTVAIHDMLRDYIREKLRDRPAKPHAALLRSYNPNGESWYRIEDDGYLYDNLAYHLMASGRGGELYRLVALGDARNEWAEARYRASGSYAGYLSDLNLAWRRAQGDEAWSATSQIRCALIQSSMRSRANDIPAELLLALVDQRIWTYGQAFSAASDNPDPEQRAEALTALAPRLDEPLLSGALRQALDAALSIHINPSHDDMLRAWAVKKLAPYLTEPLLREAMDEVRKKLSHELRDRRKPRAVAFAALVPRLAELGYPQEALDTIRDIRGIRWLKDHQATALAKVGRHLSEGLLRDALDMAREMEPSQRAYAISGLVRGLEEPLRTEVLEEALDGEALEDIADVGGGSKQTIGWGFVLHRLSPHLDEGMLRKILEAAKRFGPDRWLSVSTSLVPRLAELGHWHEALEVARRTEQRVWRARMLAGIVSHLPEDERLSVLHEAWEVAEPGWPKKELLRELTPPLPEAFLREKLKEVLAESTSDQTLLLPALAPHLAEAGCYEEALDALEEFDRCFFYDRPERIRTLVAVAVRLPEPLRTQKLEEALHAGQKIGDVGSCNSAIKDLHRSLPKLLRRDALEARGDETIMVAAALDGSLSESPLPEPLQRKALEAARAIPESNTSSSGGSTWTEHSPQRAQALTALIPYLSEPLRSEVLQEAQDTVQRIETAFTQVRILASLARYLPDLPPVTDERLQEALSQARGGKNGEDRENNLAALGPYRPEPSPREAEEALRRDEDRRRRVQTSIAALRAQDKPEDIIFPVWARDRARLERRVIFNHALSIARDIDDADDRAEALTELVPYLNEMLRPVVLESNQFGAHALDNATVLTREAMHALAPYMPESSLPKIIEAVKAIGEPDEREMTLRVLISRRSPMRLATDRILWNEALRIFAAHTRHKLLANLSAMLPMLDSLAEAEAIDKIASAIHDVARWYP